MTAANVFIKTILSQLLWWLTDQSRRYNQSQMRVFYLASRHKRITRLCITGSSEIKTVFTIKWANSPQVISFSVWCVITLCKIKFCFKIKQSSSAHRAFTKFLENCFLQKYISSSLSLTPQTQEQDKLNLPIGTTPLTPTTTLYLTCRESPDGRPSVAPNSWVSPCLCRSNQERLSAGVALHSPRSDRGRRAADGWTPAARGPGTASALCGSVSCCMYRPCWGPPCCR